MVFPYLPLTFPSFSPGPSTNEPHQGRANGSRCCTASTTSRRSPGAAGACPTRPTAVPCARCRCSETRCGKGGIYGMYWGYNGVFVYIIIYMYMYVCMYKYIYSIIMHDVYIYIYAYGSLFQHMFVAKCPCVFRVSLGQSWNLEDGGSMCRQEDSQLRKRGIASKQLKIFEEMLDVTGCPAKLSSGILR